jgi:hypothetical protein
MKFWFPPGRTIIVGTLLAIAAAAGVDAQNPHSIPAPKPMPPLVLPVPPKPDFARLEPGEAASRSAIHTPQAVEVWRPQSQSPQMPARHGRRFALAYAVGRESFTLRLRFDPRAAGKEVVVIAGPGVTIDPPGAVLQLNNGGQCTVSLKLDGAFNRSDITISCLGVQTRVPVARATLAEAQAEEARARGGR